MLVARPDNSNLCNRILPPRRRRSKSEPGLPAATVRMRKIDTVTCHPIMAEGELNVDSIITRLLEGR